MGHEERSKSGIDEDGGDGGASSANGIGVAGDLSKVGSDYRHSAGGISSRTGQPASQGPAAQVFQQDPPLRAAGRLAAEVWLKRSFATLPALQHALETPLSVRQLQRYIRAITGRQGPTFCISVCPSPPSFPHESSKAGFVFG
jgi:hypothetical protein